ncbi:MAG: IclR family transcriptional regulator C-terminal domain-containing protein, partial [Anaerolineae bacterium]
KLQKTTISSQKKFIDRLDQVRAQGFGETQDVLEVGLSAVAAPIFNTHSQVQGALCIAAPSSRMTAERVTELTQMIVNSADLISRNIGYVPEN